MLIVDDDALIRESLTILLELEEGVVVKDTAANGQEAVELCQKESYDIVLMDIRMPVMGGVEATKQIKALCPSLPIVILTTFQDDEYIRSALAFGAEGYILKGQSSEVILDALKTVVAGNTVLHKDVAQKLPGILKRSVHPLLLSSLTVREQEILSLVGEGKSNKEIAQTLFLSEGTVRNYVTSLLVKLEVRDRTQLAILYQKAMRGGE